MFSDWVEENEMRVVVRGSKETDMGKVDVCRNEILYVDQVDGTTK